MPLNNFPKSKPRIVANRKALALIRVDLRFKEMGGFFKARIKNDASRYGLFAAAAHHKKDQRAEAPKD